MGDRRDSIAAGGRAGHPEGRRLLALVARPAGAPYLRAGIARRDRAPRSRARLACCSLRRRRPSRGVPPATSPQGLGPRRRADRAKRRGRRRTAVSARSLFPESLLLAVLPLCPFCVFARCVPHPILRLCALEARRRRLGCRPASRRPASAAFPSRWRLCHRVFRSGGGTLQGIQGAPHAAGAALRNVCVNHRRPDVLRPKQLLHGADVGAGLQQMRGEAGAIVKTVRFESWHEAAATCMTLSTHVRPSTTCTIISWERKRLQRLAADWAHLNIMARLVLRVPLPLVVRCRRRIVANVDSMGLVVRSCAECSAGKSS